MGFEIVYYLTGIALIAGVGLLFVGQMFGLMAIPNLVEKTGWKYFVLFMCMLIPFLGAVVCLFHYKQTAYASRFIVFGLIALALSGLGFFAMRMMSFG